MLFALPEGSYVVPVSIPDFENIYIEINAGASGTTPLAPLYDSSLTKLAGGKLYPLVLTITGSLAN